MDDSNSIFEDLTEHEEVYSSAFDNPLLGFVKNLHDEYGIVVSFYVFYSWDVESGKFCLADATDAFKNDFAANADWLRFGFHAKDARAYETIDANEEVLYYDMTIEQLLRITGSEACIDNFVRLDRFIASADMIQKLADTDHGIIGLMVADDPKRLSYALSDDELLDVYKNDWYVDLEEMNYTPTDIRLENIKNIRQFFDDLETISTQEHVIIFTHERILEDKNVQRYMEWFAMYGKQYGYDFAFPEDRIYGL